MKNTLIVLAGLLLTSCEFGKEVGNILLNGKNPAFIVASYIAWAFGFILMMALDYQISAIKNKDSKVPFNWNYWFVDNKVRLITNGIIGLISMFWIVVYSDFFFQDREFKIWMPFLLGLSFDMVVLILRRFTKVNWFNGDPQNNLKQSIINNN